MGLQEAEAIARAARTEHHAFLREVGALDDWPQHYIPQPVGDGWVFVPKVLGINQDVHGGVHWPYYVVSPTGDLRVVPYSQGFTAARDLLAGQ